VQRTVLGLGSYTPKGGKNLVLDFHTHVYPEALAPRVITNAAAWGVSSHRDGTRASLISSMKNAGISASVVLNIAVKPGQTAGVNDFAIASCAAEDDAPALIPFAGIHPYDQNWKEELKLIKEQGFKGIKLHPDYQGFYIDDPALEPFYRRVSSLGLIMVFHTGFDIVSPENVHATPERIANVLPLLEECDTVLAHMGGLLSWEDSLRLLCGRKVYLDTSFSVFPGTVKLMRKLIRRHDPGRILFGTDSPWHDPAQSLNLFKREFAEGFLSPNDTRAILWDNGMALLNRKNASRI
jgi:predicted TIM-barrel fold metal-dependent hydrolase